MTVVHQEDRYGAYREAIRQRVCAVCLDSNDEGGCGLSLARRCAMDEQLERVVDVVLAVRDAHPGAHAAAVEAQICSRCSHREASGDCALRRDGRCALAVFLPLIVEAIMGVGGRSA
jgi:hypothetical protein